MPFIFAGCLLLCGALLAMAGLTLAIIEGFRALWDFCKFFVNIVKKKLERIDFLGGLSK